MSINGVEPPGAYAISIFHDEGNNKLNTNFFGERNEGYGFSNNVITSFGKTAFTEVSFIVNDGKKPLILA